jgi:hypothetical protein
MRILLTRSNGRAVGRLALCPARPDGAAEDDEAAEDEEYWQRKYLEKMKADAEKLAAAQATAQEKAQRIAAVSHRIFGLGRCYREAPQPRYLQKWAAGRGGVSSPLVG